MAARKLPVPGSVPVALPGSVAGSVADSAPGAPFESTGLARPQSGARHTRRWARLLILAGALCSTLPAGAAVYRCLADGTPTFAQFCAPADRIGAPAKHSRGAFVRFEPLSISERQALEQLSRELAATRRSARQRRQLANRQAQASRARAAERCAGARRALEALEEQRRKGYGASEARTLKERERALHAKRKANC